MNDQDQATTTASDCDLISKIAKRAQEDMTAAGFTPQLSDIFMDIDAAHQDVGLNLQELLEADDENFTHDINGIAQNLNRETKKLEGGFLPRFSQPQPGIPKTFKWTIEIEIDEAIVTDGFDLKDDEEITDLIYEKIFPAWYPHEVSAKLIKSPDEKDIRRAQGYKD